MTSRGTPRPLARAAAAMVLLTTGLLMTSAPPAHADTGVSELTELPFTEYGDHAVDARHGQVFLTGTGAEDPLVVTDLSGEVVRIVPELAGARRLALSPRGSALFVTVGEDVLRLDPVTLQERDRYPLPGIWWIDDLTVAGGTVWVGGGHGTRDTFTIDIATGATRRIRDDGGTFYRTTFEAVPSRGMVALLGDEHEPRVSILDARTGGLLATRTFSDEALVGLQVLPDGDLVLVRRLDGTTRALRLDPSTLRTVDSAPAPTGMPGTAATDGRLLAIGVYDQDDHGSVRVGLLRHGRVLNRYRLAFGNPLTAVEVVDTFFTPAGMVIVSAEGSESQPVRLHFVPDPSARSPRISFHLPEDAEVGQPTTVSGRLTYRGETVRGAVVRLADTNVLGEVQPAREQAVRTDGRGRYSFPFVPRFGYAQYTVRSPGTGGVPGAWFRTVREVDRPPSAITLHAPTSVAAGETITVQVQVTSHGTPADGSVIRSTSSCPPSLPVVHSTDEQGRFTLTYPSEGCSSVTVEVSSQGSPSTGPSPAASVTVEVVQP